MRHSTFLARARGGPSPPPLHACAHASFSSSAIFAVRAREPPFERLIKCRGNADVSPTGIGAARRQVHFLSIKGLPGRGGVVVKRANPQLQGRATRVSEARPALVYRRSDGTGRPAWSSCQSALQRSCNEMRKKAMGRLAPPLPWPASLCARSDAATTRRVGGREKKACLITSPASLLRRLYVRRRPAWPRAI